MQQTTINAGKTTNYTLEQNLIIKKKLPKVGIVCSNPTRAKRIAEAQLAHMVLLTEYHSAWPIDIYVGSYKGKQVFIAGIAVGAAGAAFAVQQFAAAGAQYIIRYGSNDDPTLRMSDMQQVIIVEQADNLYGLMQSSGEVPEKWGTSIPASSMLIEHLHRQATQEGLVPKRAICHHIEDYGAYAFPNAAGATYSSHIKKHLQQLEATHPHLLHTRDMESAALFFRGQLDKFHVATVLQNVPKFAGSHQTYEGQQGDIARQLEHTFSQFILNTLGEYADTYQPDFRSYFPLNYHNMVDYLKTLPILALDEPDISACEMASHMNQVFRISNLGKTWVLKQALPYIRGMGAAHALDKTRIVYETSYMDIAAAIAPKHIPKRYHSDGVAMMVIVMEDLKKHELLRDGLIKGNRYPKMTEHLSTYLARVLFQTSRFYLSSKDHAALVRQFHSNPMRQLRRDFTFIFPFKRHDTNYQNCPERFTPLFRKQILHLLERFDTRLEALNHGDFQTDSVMLNQEETMVIDSEFAMMGPLGFDLGQLIANILTAWIYHGVKKPEGEYQQWLLMTMEQLLQEFFDKFKALWSEHQQAFHVDDDKEAFLQYQHDVLQDVLQETLGFAGLELCKRVCGYKGVKEIRTLSQQAERTKAETMALNIGQYLVENHLAINDVKTYIAYLKNRAETYGVSHESYTPTVTLSSKL